MKTETSALGALRKALDDARAASASEQQLRDLLAERHIEAVFRRTEDGRIYGATFIDHARRIVLNGSRLGKAYAARAWDEWVRNPQPAGATTLSPQPNQAARTWDDRERNSQPDEAAPARQSPLLPPAAEGLSEPGLSMSVDTLLDAFAPLFEHEPQHEEYIAPEFRLLYRKRKKKKKRSRKL